MNFKSILEKQEVKASVPCRIDLGGTLDISTFFLPLGHLDPATFNIALDMRTTVTLSPWKDHRIKISSRGFDSAEFEAERAPFHHPMGLMFAVVCYFNGHGVHVNIDSSSPPRSALGGSSAAAAAMIAAFLKLMDKTVDPSETALLAHYIESSVAGVPCGLQDQLAAAFGGVNCWHWKVNKGSIGFERDNISDTFGDMNHHILVAYCGIPHVSSDINKRWVKRFLSGEDRDKWKEIAAITNEFVNAVKGRDYTKAAFLMNRETRLRMEMTPDVLDETGCLLFEAAVRQNCGARFTGAGGGGCLWAVGEKEDIEKLKNDWEAITEKEAHAKLLDTIIDSHGIL